MGIFKKKGRKLSTTQRDTLHTTSWLGLAWLGSALLCIQMERKNFFINYIQMTRNVMWSISNLWPKYRTLPSHKAVWILPAFHYENEALWPKVRLFQNWILYEQIIELKILILSRRAVFLAVFRLEMLKPRKCDIKNYGKIRKFAAKCCLLYF